MEPPMPNCSMRHQNPVGDFDDTGQILQGALCTIAGEFRAVRLCRGPWVTVTYGPHHPYSSYSSLGPIISQPIFGQKALFLCFRLQQGFLGRNGRETIRTNELYELYGCLIARIAPYTCLVA